MSCDQPLSKDQFLKMSRRLKGCAARFQTKSLQFDAIIEELEKDYRGRVSIIMKDVKCKPLFSSITPAPWHLEQMRIVLGIHDTVCEIENGSGLYIKFLDTSNMYIKKKMRTRTTAFTQPEPSEV